MSDNKSSSNDQKSKRRLKKLYSKIKKQMEFYFSDSNLAKDKFLKDLISRDPDEYVNIDVFTSFNKIKALTSNCDVIAAAVSRSGMFEVSKDLKKVRRVAPLEIDTDFDACTVYVEKLPPHADQNWVKDVFGHFGSVKYINVPRYKATNQVKGFAFVEFDNCDSVKSACEFYKIPEKECPPSEDDSKNAKNVKKNKHDQVSDKKSKKNRRLSISETSDKLTDLSSIKSEQPDASDRNIEHDHSPQKKKRKRENSESGTPVKRVKESTEESPNTSAAKSINEPKTVQPSVKTEDNSIQQKEQDQIPADEDKVTDASDNNMSGAEMEESISKRKRKNQKRRRLIVERPSLRVMPKSEWKMYRNKYLELQRTTMSLLKRQIMLEMQELKEQESHAKPMDVTETKKSVQFQPGVIIKLDLLKPVTNPSEIKDQVKASAVVAYIDAPVESSEIFIRCHNSDDAQTIVKEEKLGQLGKAVLLEGDEEKIYWEKIENDRKAKYNNPVPHKKRGRDKILSKASKLEEMRNKHIYFED